MQVLSFLSPYRKAIVPVVVAVVLFVLNKVGVTGDMSVKEAVTLVATSGLVWLVPNKA